MATIIEDLLKDVSAEDLLTLAKVKSSGTDLGTGQRDVELNNPLLYTTVEVEPAPLPEGTQLETRGRGQNVVDVLVSDQVTDNPFSRFIGGLADALTLGTFDFDKRGDWHGSDYEHKAGIRGGSGYGKVWDQEKENRLKKTQRLNDLQSGKAVPTRDEALEIIKGMSVFDEYSDERTIRKEQEALRRWINIYPDLEKVYNDAFLKRTLQKRYLDPADVQERMQSARKDYIGALEGRAKAQKDIAIATAMGLGRHSGLGNVAG
jgi:hypothetical protein